MLAASVTAGMFDHYAVQPGARLMSSTERKHDAREELFSLTIDQYGHLWLHAKLEGLPVTIDLGPKNAAFEIMAATMAENGFEYLPVRRHEEADNDDEPGRQL
jgi:hypothetical protein